MKTFSFWLKQSFIVALLFIGIACDLAKQASKVANLANCEYKVDNVNGMQLAGVNVQGKSSISQLNLTDAAKIAQAYLSGNLPLSMNVNLGVKNTSSNPAGFTSVKYIMSLDGQEINRGAISNAFTVSGNTTSTLPIYTSVDLKRSFSGKTKDAILNLVMNLAGQSSKPTMIGMKIKPSFVVNGQTIEWPSYITVDTEFKKPR